MKRFLLYFMLLLSIPAIGQVRHRLVPILPDDVMSKNCYFCFMVNRNPEIRTLLSKDKVLSQIEKEQRRLLSGTQYGMVSANELKLTDDAIDIVGGELQRLYDCDTHFRSFVDDSICATGCYVMTKGKNGVKVKNIWLHDAHAINHAIDVYGSGAKPNYPDVDSVSFNVHSPRFVNEILPLVVENSLMSNEESQTFVSIPMQAAKLLLAANGRLQAADYEPLSFGENEHAYCAASATQWEQYPYSAIVVLGVGPNSRSEHVTAESLMRAEYAAQCWKNKMVPFIIVSGGKVHPFGTPYCEAWEMKNYLVSVCHVPDSVVIIEPHARHTTTNLRNAGRIMIRQGFPMEKTALVVGSKSHIDYVVSQKFAHRFANELGFLPVSIIKRKNNFLAEFKVNESCLQLDDDEPMDP